MPNPIEAFEDLPTWGKIGVALATAGVVVFAVITLRNKSNAAAQPSVNPLGNLSSTNGATSVQSLLQGLGYDPTTGAALSTGQQTTTPATPTTTSSPTVAQQKNAAIQAWQAHTGQKWTGPPGSYPAGWLAGGDVAGAGQQYGPGQIAYKIPLSGSGGSGGSGSNASGGGPGVMARAPIVSNFGPQPVPYATSRYVRL